MIKTTDPMDECKSSHINVKAICTKFPPIHCDQLKNILKPLLILIKNNGNQQKNTEMFTNASNFR